MEKRNAAVEKERHRLRSYSPYENERRRRLRSEKERLPICVVDAQLLRHRSSSVLPLHCFGDQADEDHDDGDERWDPDSDMDIDDERELLPRKVKKEIVEPQLNDQEYQRRTGGEHLRGSDSAVAETTCMKALDICSQQVDEDDVKVERDTVNDLARETH